MIDRNFEKARLDFLAGVQALRSAQPQPNPYQGPPGHFSLTPLGTSTAPAADPIHSPPQHQWLKKFFGLG